MKGGVESPLVQEGLRLWDMSRSRQGSLMARTGLADQIIDELDLDTEESEALLRELRRRGFTFHPEVGHFVITRISGEG
jgi:hypothetical protein